jgi:hypothetical protein
MRGSSFLVASLLDTSSAVGAADAAIPREENDENRMEMPATMTMRFTRRYRIRMILFAE